MNPWNQTYAYECYTVCRETRQEEVQNFGIVQSGVAKKTVSLFLGNDADVYFPTNDGGKTVAGTNLIVICFAHGSFITADKYEYLAVPWTQTGKYIVIVPRFLYDGILNTSTFGRNNIRYIKKCQGNGSIFDPQPFWLRGKVANVGYYVAGHSAGGAACAYTANEYPTGLLGYLALGPSNDLLSGARAKLATITAPTVFLTGSKDCVVSPAAVKDFYDGLTNNTTNKWFGNMLDASHCQWCSPPPSVCTAAEFCSGFMADYIQAQAAVQFSLAFFNDPNTIGVFFTSPATSFTGVAAGVTWKEYCQNNDPCVVF